MIETASATTSTRPRRRAAFATAVATLIGVAVAVAAPAPIDASGPADDDWLGIVNTYRAMSGLAPVGANATWSAEGRAHSCYMLQNGITHDEDPNLPGYTPGGDVAGNSGNVAVSSSASATARNHIDLWMTGPFHAIGILRPTLATSGFGLCSSTDTPTPWQSGGTLDVIRGIDQSRPRPTQPIVFPGRDATVPLTRFITEFPDPMAMCGWSGEAGLPLIALMPNAVSTATATITGPNGPIDTCALHPGNTSGTAQAILGGDNGVVIMPRQVLTTGTYTVTATSDGGSVTWSFHVDPDAPLAVPAAEPTPAQDTAPSADPTDFQPVEPFRLVDTRRNLGATKLRAGKPVRISAAADHVAAISANFVAVQPRADGHVTVYDCGAEVPNVSTLGYRPFVDVANQAIVPLDRGDFCVVAHTDVDLVVDVNGFYRDGNPSAGFQPVTPARLFDTRDSGRARLRAGVERAVRVTGVVGGAPVGADALALNVTAIDGPSAGHLQVYPCGATASAGTSTINYRAREARPNSVVVGTDGDGRICLTSLTDLDVAIDYTGFFDNGTGLAFTPLSPIRLFDSRERGGGLNESTAGARVRAGQVVRLQIAGVRGIPGDAAAASVNLTVTQSDQALHVTAFPCGPRPSTSNLNVDPFSTSANGAMVKLSGSGELCVYTLRDVHLIVDINGVWG